MNKKKLIASLAAVALVAVVGIGATLAYFTDTEDVSNVVTMGHVDITLTETDKSGEQDVITAEGLTFNNVLPGQTIAKDPTIKLATGSQNAYVRAKIVIGDANDTITLTDEQKAALIRGMNINTTNWFLAEDGYYYYQTALTSTEQMAQLFTTVTIPAAWNNAFADKTFSIKIQAEAIQAENFTPDASNGVITGWAGVTAENYVAPTAAPAVVDAQN